MSLLFVKSIILFLCFIFQFSRVSVPFHANETFANKAVYCAGGIYNPHKRYKWHSNPRKNHFKNKDWASSMERGPGHGPVSGFGCV